MKRILRILALITVIAVIIFLLTREFNLEALVQTGGIFAIGAVVFAETGMLIGFFLPGDTLLFAAGFFASQGQISIVLSIVAIVLGAILGNMVGYEIGKRGGDRIFSSDDSVFFHKKYIDKSEHFFKKHGGKTILFARFVPVVRTLAPLMAGIAKIDYKKFMFYNISGALMWGISVTMIGYFAGKLVGEYFNIDRYLLPIILLATVLTFGVSLLHALREPQTRHVLIKKIKRNIKLFFKK